MPKIIVADTSCLILFNKIDSFKLFKKVYGQIHITETVFEEFDQEVPPWINIVEPTSSMYKGLTTVLDLGEATSISLASENDNSLLIIDEVKGRKIARMMGVRITGTLGVLVTAKRKGYIKEVKPFISEIQQTNFRISDKLISRVLEKVDEA